MKLYLAFMAAMSASCIFLGVIALKGEGRKYARKLFFLMCFTMSIFLFCAGYSVSGDERETVVFWYRLSSLGFAPFNAFNLHFYLNLAYGNGFRKKDLLIYIPVPFIIASTFISSSLYKDFILLNGIWRYSPAYGSPMVLGISAVLLSLYSFNCLPDSQMGITLRQTDTAKTGAACFCL